MTSHRPASRVERLLRTLAPRVLGAVARRHEDFAAAEDAVQEALLAAARRWPEEGTPANPGGWLYQAARRRLLDRVRSEAARRRREDAAAREWAGGTAFLPSHLGEFGADPDDTLALLYMCCHPVLPPPSAIPLTLRAVGGLTTREIASALLVRDATMGQRISRAKRTLAESEVRLRIPEGAERRERTASVMQVLYLIFNEGYSASRGPALVRIVFSEEAIRLARLLLELTPDDPEVEGLLALMLLTDARRPARTDRSGALVPLAEQDRSLWDGTRIAEGTELIERALPRGRVGPYQLQAAIAALHGEAGTVEETDWPQIHALYGLLLRVSPGPVVALNHAVAAAMVHGPGRGLTLLERLDDDPRIVAHHRLAAVRGHLHEMAGRGEEALRWFRIAADGARNPAERNYLLLKAAKLEKAVRLEKGPKLEDVAKTAKSARG